jgi:hypothetical protein
MTEEEAKKKICPIFKLQEDNKFVFCYASECMMWIPKWSAAQIPEDTPKEGNCGLKQLRV